jgi:hypothetical protein
VKTKQKQPIRSGLPRHAEMRVAASRPIVKTAPQHRRDEKPAEQMPGYYLG